MYLLCQFPYSFVDWLTILYIHTLVYVTVFDVIRVRMRKKIHSIWEHYWYYLFIVVSKQCRHLHFNGNSMQVSFLVHRHYNCSLRCTSRRHRRLIDDALSSLYANAGLSLGCLGGGTALNPLERILIYTK